jgi:IS5 family transposase
LARELSDASTICRFRNRLVKARFDQKQLNRQLQQCGLKVQGTRRALIDAILMLYRC